MDWQKLHAKLLADILFLTTFLRFEYFIFRLSYTSLQSSLRLLEPSIAMMTVDKFNLQSFRLCRCLSGISFSVQLFFPFSNAQNT